MNAPIDERATQSSPAPKSTWMTMISATAGTLDTSSGPVTPTRSASTRS
ncbi:MAG: hypothetical protein PSX37_09225 [bacterium]|nr:hypothetical protein [bacterium]